MVGGGGGRRSEEIGNLVVGGEEPLRLSGRLEALHEPLPSSGRLMAVLRAVVETLVLAVLDARHHGPVTYLCRFRCSFRLLGVRRPRGFFLPMLNADGAGYRSR